MIDNGATRKLYRVRCRFGDQNSRQLLREVGSGGSLLAAQRDGKLDEENFRWDERASLSVRK